MNRTDPRELTAARIAAHRAAQWLARAARAAIPPVADDSHSNLGWEPDFAALATHDIGGSRLALRLEDLTLLRITADGARDSLAIDDGTQAGPWVDDQLRGIGVESSARAVELPYELPAAGSSPAREALAELANWFGVADTVLQEFKKEHNDLHPGPSDVRCWPHHFDIATLVSLEEGDPETAAAVGVGLSPGDETQNQPYLYVNPYPSPRGDTPPILPPPGRWQTAGFTGAIALGEELIGLADLPEGMLAFLLGAFEAVRPKK